MHGFYNNGNTCYFNSAVQCVLHINGLSKYILEHPYTGKCPFTIAYRELVKLYFTEKKMLKIDIAPLLHPFQGKYPRFKAMQPHDAQDALFCIIDILEIAYPYIKTLVYGEKEQHTVYPRGKKVSKEPFSMLLLHGENGKSVDELVKKAEDWHTLVDYVDDDGEKYNVATTRNGIITYPPVLFVSFDKKVRVAAEDILEKYQVTGSIIHTGTQSGGHYISMIKLDDKWFLQDDTNIVLIDFPVIQDHHVLMYTLKNPPS